MTTTKKKTAKKSPRSAATKERAVVVTTAHRGVFFGHAKATDGEQIALRAAQLCSYWSADMRGFMGLASMGPSAKCRIGKPADITLRNITAVAPATATATDRTSSLPQPEHEGAPPCTTPGGVPSF